MTTDENFSNTYHSPSSAPTSIDFNGSQVRSMLSAFENLKSHYDQTVVWPMWHKFVCLTSYLDFFENVSPIS